MSSRFNVTHTRLSGVVVLERKPIGDRRGYLERMFCSDELQEVIGSRKIAQVNITLTARRGTVRGMHFQWQPHAETKFISCLRGKVFDVGVDLRRGSLTFLQWHGEVLSPENHRTLVVPEGCAHGFQTMSEDCELLYFHTAPFQPQGEGGLHAQDPMVAIQWPEEITELSARDTSHPLLTADFEGLTI